MLFDLNELPTEAEEEAAPVVSQPQKTLPVPTTLPSFLPPQEVSQSQGILNNNAFKHASSGSGFQPFVRSKDSQITKEPIKIEDNLNASVASTSMVIKHSADDVDKLTEPSNQISQAVEREEGEWSDADVASDTAGSSVSKKEEAASAATQVKRDIQESEPTVIKSGDMIKDEISAEPSDTEMTDVPKDPVIRGPTGLESMKNVENTGNQPGDDSDLSNRSKDVKGVEANFALKFASNPSKRPKFDEHKEAMLGKKRARQTVFINVEDAKQAGTLKTSTPRRQSSFPAPIVTRTVKEAFRSAGCAAERAAEKQSQPAIREQRQSEMLGSERSNSADPIDQNSESNGDPEMGSQARLKKMNAEEPLSDGYQQPMPRQLKGQQISSQRSVVTGQSTADQKPANKRSLASKKQTPANNTQYQDTSVERLIREVTSDKFWHNPEEAELQCVPGSFESTLEYIRVFEPLLFEECRAQLYSSYEESLESVSRDAHVMVRVKTVERRERGWYDVVVLPMHEYKWTFKEGEVAILSFPRPGSASQSSRSNRKNVGSNEDTESECGRLVGTVRRHTPIDTRDPIGAIIHFYVGDSFDSSRCVLVGDPQQHPATVISKAAGTLLYIRSLFERFQQAGWPTILLSVQYRMHPQIREFPSRYFYQGSLSDSESVVKLPDEAYYRDALMAPYIFFDFSHGRESHRGGSSSYQNVHEAQFALRLYEHLQKFLKANGGKKASVGIITPYKLQLKCLQREFEVVMSTEEGKDIYINTVDAFQGLERDVIIMSCVRASNHGVGFVADIRCMNVVLTRARRALWVVGNANALMLSVDWAALIADAKLF
ncbi:hypothetical protein ABZP36_031105 [Zizania latifolia]